jgi:fluoroquinolone transport system permease protein
MASNMIQGIAMVRALGMVIAGLPWVPWFIDSAWNLAFGVLPPYCAAKPFWVASAHGTWWPYLLVGVVYNLAVAGRCFADSAPGTPNPRQPCPARASITGHRADTCPGRGD